MKGTTMAKINVFERADGKWAWSLVAANGDIIATDGNQGYENKSDCESMASRIVSGEFIAATATF
jgi:uncharacterized protein YegP (UPF0339 family)